MADNRQGDIPGAAWILLIVLGLFWGASFFFARVAVGEIPPITLAFLRFVLAAIALHLYLGGRFGLYRTLRARWKSFAVLGLINNAIPHTFIFFGQTEIGAGLASILNATTPIWTVLIAHLLTQDEKLTPQKIVGTIAGLAGTVVLFAPHLGDRHDIPLWAMLLPVAAAISYGFSAIYGRKFRDIPAPVTATGQLTASTLMMLPVSMIHDKPWLLPMPSTEAIAAVLALAILSTAIGYILYFRIITLAGATNASLVTLLVPPSAILLGTIVLGERLEASHWLGMAMIALSLVVLDGRLLSGIRRLLA